MARIPFTEEFEAVSKWDEPKLDAYLNQIAEPQSDERQYRRPVGAVRWPDSPVPGGTESISVGEPIYYAPAKGSIVYGNHWEAEGEQDRREKRKAMIERFNGYFPAFPIEQEEFPGILSTIELPELDNLEKADTFVKTQSEKVQAYLYKALYLNDMRIDKAETIISKDKK